MNLDSVCGDDAKNPFSSFSVLYDPITAAIPPAFPSAAAYIACALLAASIAVFTPFISSSLNLSSNYRTDCIPASSDIN